MDRSPDWKSLVDLALSDPPQPDDLRFYLDAWGQRFTRENKREPAMQDYPDPLPWFFWRLAYADVPLAAIAWAEQFHETHGRYPDHTEMPKQLQPAKKGIGRPLNECARWVEARKVWIEESAQSSYEQFRDMFETIKAAELPTNGYQFSDAELSRVHEGAFSGASIAGEKPSQLAIELTGVYFGVGDERARNLIFPGRRRKKGTTA